MAVRMPPEPILALAAGVLADFRRAFVPLTWFEIVFKSLVAAFSFVGGWGLLAILLRSTGVSAVTNTDIAEFFLSPTGVLVAVLIGLSALLITILEHLGVMAIVARTQQGQKVTTLEITETLAWLMIPLLRLKAKGLAFLALTATPLALLAGLTYTALLTRHDINYYLADRPPSFLAAAAIGGVLGTIFLAVLAYGYVRTVFLFPIMLFENLPVRAAFSESLRRTNGDIRRLGAVLLGWHVFGVVLTTVVIWVFTGLAGPLLHLVAARYRLLVPLVALLLALHAILLAALSSVLIVFHCLLILRLYRERDEAVGEAAPEPASALAEQQLGAPMLASVLRSWKMAALASLAVFIALCIGVFQQPVTPGNVVVTAHKGFSRVAPENSLSAIRKAIEIGADYAEIDVQETADGEVVLNHDRDLMRVAGVPRRIREMALAEIRAVDIGSKFSPEFAGERVPTLAEVIDLARGKIKVQIELKFYDKDRTLAEKVARMIEREQFESQCVISSLHYDALLEARRVNPRLRTAAIVTFAIGDIDRLEVDALSVNVRNLSNRLIRAARARHKDLYAWTVDDPRQMIALMERGVSNIVTNVPDVLIDLRDRFTRLTDIELRLLAARYLLGLEPELASSEPDAQGP